MRLPSPARPLHLSRPRSPYRYPQILFSRLLQLSCWGLLAAAETPLALADTVRNCSTDSSDLMCRLSSVLHALYVVAIVLGILLLAVVLLAVRLYRRNKVDRKGVL